MNNQEYAGFWIRVGATCIDALIIIMVIFIPLSFIYGSGYWLSDKYIQGFWDFVLTYIFPFIATVWFWLRFFGTPGKLALKLKVVDAKSGKKLSLGQAVGRYFAYIPAILPLGLGLFWVGIDSKKQGWHDKLAGTVVVRSNKTVPVEFESEEIQKKSKKSNKKSKTATSHRLSYKILSNLPYHQENQDSHIS